MKFAAIIWDFDGTLASSLEGITAAMGQTLATHRLPIPTVEQVRATVGLTLEQSMRHLAGVACSEQQIAQLVTHYRRVHNSHAAPLTKAFDGADRVLAESRRRGMLNILVSNKGRAGLHQLLGQLSLDGQFDHVLSAEDVSFCKPDPRLYSLDIAPRYATLRPDQVLVVGDTETDLNFARSAELKSCWAKYGYGNHQACRMLQPQFVIESIAELFSVLDN